MFFAVIEIMKIFGDLDSQKQRVEGMQKDYSEYVPSGEEQYRLARRGNELITFEYFNNFVRFDHEHKTLDIRVDREKESL